MKFINDRGLEDLGVLKYGGRLKLDLLQYILALWIYYVTFYLFRMMYKRIVVEERRKSIGIGFL